MEKNIETNTLPTDKPLFWAAYYVTLSFITGNITHDEYLKLFTPLKEKLI